MPVRVLRAMSQEDQALGSIQQGWDSVTAGASCPATPLGVPLAVSLLSLSPLSPPQVCGEKNRFEKLMEYFRNEDTNIDFMVSDWRGCCSAVPRPLCPQAPQVLSPVLGTTITPSHRAIPGEPCLKGCQALVLSPRICVPKSHWSIPRMLHPKGCQATGLSIVCPQGFLSHHAVPRSLYPQGMVSLSATELPHAVPRARCP